MNSKKSFKIEMAERQMAKEFLTKKTHINNIILPEESKEPETDPTINQCWDCGQINPNHSSNNNGYPGRKLAWNVVNILIDFMTTAYQGTKHN